MLCSVKITNKLVLIVVNGNGHLVTALAKPAKELVYINACALEKSLMISNLRRRFLGRPVWSRKVFVAYHLKRIYLLGCVEAFLLYIQLMADWQICKRKDMAGEPCKNF